MKVSFDGLVITQLLGHPETRVVPVSIARRSRAIPLLHESAEVHLTN